MPPLFFRHGARPPAPRLVLLVSLGLAWGCGGRTSPPDEVDASPLETFDPTPETCNLGDEDLDGAIDEDFRDSLGNYLRDEHCGACDRPCAAGTTCALVLETPRCLPDACPSGEAVGENGECVARFERLCFQCLTDEDCGLAPGAACVDFGTGRRNCVAACEAGGCPDGYACTDDRCVPAGGSCDCDPGDTFDIACELGMGELSCAGRARCEDGVLSACVAFEEQCNEEDDDCDGNVDEAFTDERGVYSVDPRNCGSCGVDCTVEVLDEGSLVCGGDPLAPSCVLACPDAEDGLQPGDEIDADRDIATGCECVFTSRADVPGPVDGEGDVLDVNCDGADGIVVESIYVAPDGDDRAIGSPTRPMASIGAALVRARESLASARPRPHVFVASGRYAETVVLEDGVQLHGGYRRDFRALAPDAFLTEVVATDSAGELGAALEGRGVGRAETVVEWMTFVGRDAAPGTRAAVAAVLVAPGNALSVRDCVFRAGRAASGEPGLDGDVGASPAAEAAVGQLPREAVEDPGHNCRRGDVNQNAGGVGGQNVCEGDDVSGGQGGVSACPSFANFQPSGSRGRGAEGGAGGRGGQDSMGPIPMGPSCASFVCCGLADFTVPTDFQGPRSGNAGGDGFAGRPGTSCTDPAGTLDVERWTPIEAGMGTAGRAGSGGGGGGAGGGVEMDWTSGLCEWPDGLGGGGGGGGAGGCGGDPGRPGESGGPSVAMHVIFDGPDADLPTLSGNRFVASDAGDGGAGGAGGDGGSGGVGALGGALARSARTTPPLSAPFPGGRGGRGGNGGAGGGGGAGCGGHSVGLWVSGRRNVGTWQSDNDFTLGRPGDGGAGGGGAAAAPAGASGEAIDVFVR